MKKFFFSIALLFVAFATVNAQNYKPFKLGLGLGYAIPDGGGGVLFAVEPAYRVNDAIAVGLRMEWAAMAKSVGDVEAEVSSNGSYTLNGQYYLSDNTFRPYVGLGFGLFSIASVGFDDTDFELDASSKFGLYPRIGADIGHFNINIDYNIIPKTEESYEFGGVNYEYEFKNSYIGIRIGAFIFGGKI